MVGNFYQKPPLVGSWLATKNEASAHAICKCASTGFDIHQNVDCQLIHMILSIQKNIFGAFMEMLWNFYSTDSE